MSKFIVEMINTITGAIMDEKVDDEVFNSREDAEEYARECNCDFATGEEELDLMGEDSIPSENVDFVATEIDE